MYKADRKELIVVGGGLAGSEAAWQAAQRGIQVSLYEMRPLISTGAHIGDSLAELVCSNSLGSDLPNRAQGLLKQELRQLGSLLINCADRNRVPAGGALAVDRVAFSRDITLAISEHPNINLIREEVVDIPASPTIIASGPLTSKKLSNAIEKFTGRNRLYFYDAIAPIIYADSIDTTKTYRASRYGRGDQEEGDYINCPLNHEEYEAFVRELVSAKHIPLKEFELDIEHGVRAGLDYYFERCLPIELLAGRNINALAFGPLKPVGLSTSLGGKAPYAVVQLRQDNQARTLYNLVGFQTNLVYSEQQRIIHMIPGLEKAIIARYGQMHRNTFINSPELLSGTMQYKYKDNLFFTGQITGVEGYVGNIATGLVAGINAARFIMGKELLELPSTTMIGALCNYISHADPKTFQPMKANFGILPSIDDTKVKVRGKQEKSKYYTNRAESDLSLFLESNNW